MGLYHACAFLADFNSATPTARVDAVFPINAEGFTLTIAPSTRTATRGLPIPITLTGQADPDPDSPAFPVEGMYLHAYADPCPAKRSIEPLRCARGTSHPRGMSGT